MKKVLCSAALVLVTAGWGYGATISYVDSIGYQSDNTTFAPVSISTLASNSLSVSQFNSSLGTLTGIEISLWGNFWENTAINASDPTKMVSWGKYKSGSWTDAGTIASITVGTGTPRWTLDVTPTALSHGTAMPSVLGQVILNSATGSDTNSDTSSDFTYYTGTGSVAFGTGYDLGWTGQVLNSSGADYGGDISLLLQVTYTYDKATPPAVPEPATMLLFGTGLLGLAGVARRRVM